MGGTLSISPGGAVTIQGTVSGHIEIAEDGFALIQAIVVGTIVNRGRLLLVAFPASTGTVTNLDNGKQLSRVDLPDHVRRMRGR